MRIPRALVPALPCLLAAALGVAACGSSSTTSAAGQAGQAGQLTLYTSVTQNTVTAVLNGFDKLHPGVKVSVFRATTGQLNARIAASALALVLSWGTSA